MTIRTITQNDKDKAARLSKLWKEKKRELALTQRTVATKFGYKSQSMVSMQLTGEVALNTEAVLKWANLLRVQPSEIDPTLSGLSFNSIPLRPVKVPIIARMTGGPVGPFESVEVYSQMRKQVYGVSVDVSGFEPFAKLGSTLIVSRDEEPITGDEVFIVLSSAKGKLHLIKEFVTTDLSRDVHVVRDLRTGNSEELMISDVEVIDPIIGIERPVTNRPLRLRPPPVAAQ